MHWQMERASRGMSARRGPACLSRGLLVLALLPLSSLSSSLRATQGLPVPTQPSPLWQVSVWTFVSEIWHSLNGPDQCPARVLGVPEPRSCVCLDDARGAYPLTLIMGRPTALGV
jgi:hypothetical protein